MYRSQSLTPCSAFVGGRADATLHRMTFVRRNRALLAAMGRWSRGLAPVLLGMLVLVGCAGVRQEPTLYERLGGARAIYAVVDDFVGRVTTDSRVKRYFDGSNLPLVRQQLTQFVCQAAGGPCTYLGADMKTAHVGLGISDADFDAVVEDLTVSLDKFNVAPRDKAELLALLGRTRADVVEKKP